MNVISWQRKTFFFSLVFYCRKEYPAAFILIMLIFIFRTFPQYNGKIIKPAVNPKNQHNDKSQNAFFHHSLMIAKQKKLFWYLLDNCWKLWEKKLSFLRKGFFYFHPHCSRIAKCYKSVKIYWGKNRISSLFLIN